MAERKTKILTPALMEKRWFPWRVEKCIVGRSAVFPGCNAVNYLPNTTKAVLKLARELNCGWIVDCCGKPLVGTGFEAPVIQRIENDIKAYQITELLVMCPNCLETLRARVSVPVKPIYQWLDENNVPVVSEAPEGKVFQACPDRKTEEMLNAYKRWTGYPLESAQGLPCCGLDSGAKAHAKKFRKRITDYPERLYSYCASCQSQFQRWKIGSGIHLLTWALGVQEKPVRGVWALLNRLWPIRHKQKEG